MKFDLLGLFCEPSGYGKMAREYAYALYKKGVVCSHLNLTDSSIDDLHVLPYKADVIKESFTKTLDGSPIVYLFTPESYKRHNHLPHIGYCELETNRLPSDWVKRCNQMDEIWVPTKFFMDIAKESGIVVPIRVIPQGIDCKEFNPGEKPIRMNVPAPFKFFTNGEFIKRKNIDMVLRAFIKEFKPVDDVALVIKTYDLSDPEFKTNIQKKVKEIKGKSPLPIYLINDFVGDSKLPGIYKNMNCYIQASSGEGWGIPPLESLAMEVPTIVTGWGTMNEVLPDNIVDKINYKLVDVPMQGIPNDKLFKGSQWAEPDEEHLMFLMRKVYRDHIDVLKKAKAGREYLIQNLSWDKAAEEVIKAHPKKFEYHKDMNPKKMDNPRIWMLCPTLGGQCGIATYTEALVKPMRKKIKVSDKEGDVLHIQFQYGLYQIQSLQKLVTLTDKMILTMHDYDIGAKEHNEIIKKYSDKIIVHSQLLYDTMLDNGYKNLVLIPHGISEDIYLSTKAKQVPVKKDLFGYFGFAYPHKGLREAGIAAKMTGKRLKIITSIGINNTSSMDYWEITRRFFNRMNIWPNIDLRKEYIPKEQIAIEMAECEAILMPYTDYGNIGTSGAVREVITAGRPIILTNTPFFSDLQDICISIKDNKPETIAEAIKNVRPCCYDEYIHKCSWDNVADKHISVYRSVL